MNEKHREKSGSGANKKQPGKLTRKKRELLSVMGRQKGRIWYDAMRHREAVIKPMLLFYCSIVHSP